MLLRQNRVQKFKWRSRKPLFRLQPQARQRPPRPVPQAQPQSIQMILLSCRISIGKIPSRSDRRRMAADHQVLRKSRPLPGASLFHTANSVSSFMPSALAVQECRRGMHQQDPPAADADLDIHRQPVKEGQDAVLCFWRLRGRRGRLPIRRCGCTSGPFSGPMRPGSSC